MFEATYKTLKTLHTNIQFWVGIEKCVVFICG